MTTLSMPTTSSGVTCLQDMNPGQVVQAMYEYTEDAMDGKILKCAVGETFIVIKATKPVEWLYVVNASGGLGYIPANFVALLQVEDSQFLHFVDSIIGRLSNKPTTDMVTARQINHAKVKLTQVRVEVSLRMQSSSAILVEEGGTCSEGTPEGTDGPSMPPPFGREGGEGVTPHTEGALYVKEPVPDDGSCHEEDIKSGLEEVSASGSDGAICRSRSPAIETREMSIQTDTVEVEDKTPQAINCDTQTSVHEDPKSEPEIEPEVEVDAEEEAKKIEQQDLQDEQLVLELIEHVRVVSQLNHSLCKSVAFTVLETLGDQIPEWKDRSHRMRDKIHSSRSTSPEGVNSSDAFKLNNLFRSLWYCQSDEQQRSWPVHEDEVHIVSTLKDLSRILSDANPSISRDMICHQHYDPVHMLVTYFQMEMRRNIRMHLMSILLQVAALEPNVIDCYLLTSVLPSAITDEMTNHWQDEERFSVASKVFTTIFCTGRSPPLTLYDHLNEKFLLTLLNIVEGTDCLGNRVISSIPMEVSLPPILSFNLHFQDRSENLVLRALKKRPTASQLTENLVSYLNWEEDPTMVTSSCMSDKRPNAVHKLLIEIFDAPDTSKLFYFNDVRVVIDIVITHLNNLRPGDKGKVACLRIAERIIRNTTFIEEPHKPDELLKCLNGIITHESSTEEEKQLADGVRKLLSFESN